MSFPFLQPYAGLSNSLQTAQAAVGGTVGGWVEVGRTTLGSNGDDIEVSSLADKRYYMVLVNSLNTGAISSDLRLGNGSTDTGSNYAYRYAGDGGGEGTGTTATSMIISNSGVVINNILQVNYLANLSGKEKLLISHTNHQNTAGAANVPFRFEAVGKWANTSNPLDTVTAHNRAAGSFISGSECVVLGWDPADTHTSNFWEELASVELGSAATEIDSGTISAKKYLWCQMYHPEPAAAVYTKIRFNNDTGNTMAWRRSNNGGADVTGTSDDEIRVGESRNLGNFINCFIINNSANEKLIMGHGVHQQTAGATTAPDRDEFVGKWANTSTQITNIDFFPHTGTYPIGTILKVWGAD